jgi:hypothetical protein
MIASDRKHRGRDVMTEAVFAGEKIEEFPAQQ